jgi:hypothetical protein
MRQTDTRVEYETTQSYGDLSALKIHCFSPNHELIWVNYTFTVSGQKHELIWVNYTLTVSGQKHELIWVNYTHGQQGNSPVIDNDTTTDMQQRCILGCDAV